ncbi:MAG: PEP-CTERM sorting domain-containing protein [Chthoniobacteraceae bacterium]
MNISKWFAGWFLLSFPVLHAATLDPSIIHQWNLDETSGKTAYDSVGGWNFTVVGGATLGVPAVEDTGVALTGSREFLSTGLVDTSFLLSDFSITLWVLFSNAGGSHGLLEFAYGNVTLGVKLDDITLQPQLATSSAASTDNTPTMNDGQWHLISMVNSANVVTMYMDATAVQSLKTPAFSSSTVFEVGSYDGHYLSDGTVDDITIYNRALSASEIAAQAVPEPGTTGLMLAGAIASLRRPRKGRSI